MGTVPAEFWNNVSVIIIVPHDVQDELRKLEEEKNKEQEDLGVYKNFTKAFQGAADRTEAVTDEPEGT